MILSMFCVHDSKAEAYLAPFFQPSRGLAIRMITDACSKPDHDFAKYAADFTLFAVGEFEQDTGLFTAYEAPVNLGCLLQYQSADASASPMQQNQQTPLFNTSSPRI